MNCESLNSIQRDCSSAIGGIRPKIYIGDSNAVDWEGATFDSIEEFLIETLTTSEAFEEIEFRNNVGSLEETYSLDNDGAIVFEQTLSLPIHGRDASKSRKITVMASGQRLLDIVVQQNDGKYVYLREVTLSEVGEGTGTEKTEGSKYALTFTGQSEHLSYFIDKDAIEGLVNPE